jgi:hypothetical protein
MRLLGWVIGIVVLAAQGNAMASMVIFSAVSGKVLQAGQPVAGAVVEREFRWAWKEENGKDAATTDAAGEFRLPAIERNSLLGSVLPHEPMVRQTILIKHAGKTHKAWLVDKSNYDDNGELKGKPIRLTCRLESQPARRGEVFGICELD